MWKITFVGKYMHIFLLDISVHVTSICSTLFCNFLWPKWKYVLIFRYLRAVHSPAAAYLFHADFPIAIVPQKCYSMPIKLFVSPLFWTDDMLLQTKERQRNILLILLRDKVLGNSLTLTSWMWKCNRNYLLFMAIAFWQFIMATRGPCCWESAFGLKAESELVMVRIFEFPMTTPSNTLSPARQCIPSLPKHQWGNNCQRLWGTFIIQITIGRLMANLRAPQNVKTSNERKHTQSWATSQAENWDKPRSMWGTRRLYPKALFYLES